jgi:hypothetical protein
MADHPKILSQKRLIAIGSVGEGRAGLAAALAIALAGDEVLNTAEPMHIVRLQTEPSIQDAVLTRKDVVEAGFRPRGHRRQDVPRPKDQYRHRHQRP